MAEREEVKPGEKRDTIPVYKLIDGVLVKVGEISREEALEMARFENPEVEDVKAMWILSEDPVEAALEEELGEDVTTVEFNLWKELEEIEESSAKRKVAKRRKVQED